MNVLPLVKIVAEGVASVGVGHVVSNAIKATTPADITRYQQVMIGIGSVVISGIATKAASNYVTDAIDSVTDLFKKKEDPQPTETPTEDN